MFYACPISRVRPSFYKSVIIVVVRERKPYAYCIPIETYIKVKLYFIIITKNIILYLASLRKYIMIFDCHHKTSPLVRVARVNLVVSKTFLYHFITKILLSKPMCRTNEVPTPLFY